MRKITRNACKITRNACSAFEAGYDFFESNTRVENNKMYLWGNLIAYKENGDTYITLAGWNTRTTRERLNGLHGVSITTKQGTPYLNGEPITSRGVYKV